MKNNGQSTVYNWHYITVSLIFTVAILLCVLYLPLTKDFDSGMLQAVRANLSWFPQVIPAILGEFGRYHFLWPLIASCGILVSHKYYIPAFLLVFFTQGAYVLTDFIKNIVCRQRPCGNAYPGYSFPSGHSLIAMCFFGILIYLVYRHVSGFWKYFYITILGLLIILTGLSRLYLGVHFPTDVLAGLLIGFILVNLYIILDKFFAK